MSYTDDAALAKLSALNDTQDSIATAAQWFLFHRKHADRTVQLWNQRLQGVPSSQRLTLIYLANELAQQSKVRRKDDFVLALAPIVADSVAAAFKGASRETQQRVVRVVDVWRQRSVFDEETLASIDSRLQELDRSRGAMAGFGARGSQPVPPLPTELVPVADALMSIAKTIGPSRSSLSESRENYDRVMDPAAADVPPPPVYAARLTGLIRNLNTAELATKNCIRARKNLIDSLEHLIASAQRDLDADQKHLDEIMRRKTEVEDKKQVVEAEIMRALAANDKPKSPNEAPAQNLQPPEPDRPAVEALTPPPPDDAGPFKPPPAPEPVKSPQAPSVKSLSDTPPQYQSVPVHTNGSNKRRRVEADDEFPDLGADDGIDADVAEMLRKESQSS